MGKPLAEALGEAVAQQRIWLTTEELAARFRTVPSTCRFWRMKGVGPRGALIGRRVLYDLGEVERWEAEQLAKAIA